MCADILPKLINAASVFRICLEYIIIYLKQVLFLLTMRCLQNAYIYNMVITMYAIWSFRSAKRHLFSAQAT